MNKTSLLFTTALFILSFFLSSNAWSQINIQNSQYTFCGGDTIGFYAVVNDSTDTMQLSSFNSGSFGTNWNSTSANPIFTNPCGLGPDSIYLWVGATPSNQRTLETQNFNLSGAKYASVNFWMSYGRSPASGSCEDPDQSNEGVHLQYSTDNGVSWNDFPGPSTKPQGNLGIVPPFKTQLPGSGTYWTPTYFNSDQQVSTLYYWNRYRSILPDSLLTSSIRFRWAQLVTSNAGWDAWGIDEVEITINNYYNPDDFVWSNNTYGLSAKYYFPEKANAYDTTIAIQHVTNSTIVDSITVTVLPRPTVNFTQAPDTICQNTPVEFVSNLNNNSAYTYSWKINSISVVNNNSSLDTAFNYSGYYTITLIVNNGSCTESVSTNIFVKPGVQKPLNFNVGPLSGCDSVMVDFNINPKQYYHHWIINNQIFAMQDSLSYTFNSAGLHFTKLIVTDTTTGCSLEKAFQIKVGAQPQVDFSVNPQNLTLFNSTAQFTNLTVINDTVQVINSYGWLFGDGGASFLPNPTHTYSAAGTYTPTLTITTDIGCSDSTSKTITVVTSIKELEDYGFSISPNPAKNYILIDNSNMEDAEIKLISLSGQTILVKKIQQKQNRINLQGLSDGVYILEINSASAGTIRTKFIKTK